MTNRTEREAAQAMAWAESDAPATITADDPRVQHASPDGHERMRQLLTEAAAGDPDSEQLLARANLGGRPSLDQSPGKSPTLTLRAPQALLDDLRQVAAHQHRSMSEVLREAAETYVHTHRAS